MPTFKSPVFGVASLRSPGKATFLVGSELNGLTLFVTRRLASEISRLGKVMEETAQANVAYLQRRGGSKADSDRYRKAQARYSELQNERMRRLQANAVRKAATSAAKPKPAHTFVNGFGEATNRYVTTGTYERARKRAEKAVLRNMGY